MTEHRKETFEDRVVFVDGNSYHGCRFIRCNITYSGGNLAMDGNYFDRCEFTFDGPASRTVEFMRALYSNPGFAQIIERTFDNIRGTPSAPTSKQ